MRDGKLYSNVHKEHVVDDESGWRRNPHTGSVMDKGEFVVYVLRPDSGIEEGLRSGGIPHGRRRAQSEQCRSAR